MGEASEVRGGQNLFIFCVIMRFSNPFSGCVWFFIELIWFLGCVSLV